MNEGDNAYAEADHIVAEVFRLTGTRITRDDPATAILLMQRQFYGRRWPMPPKAKPLRTKRF